MTTKRMGLYIHIPFCIKKCNYCDFLSFPINSSCDIGDYITALNKRISFCGGKYSDYIIDTIYIGGGTPSVLAPGQTASVIDAIFTSFNINPHCEISMECNPGTVDETKLLTYKTCGINRLSFGLQSADARELALLGRIHGYPDFLQSYELAREIGFNNINIDIMSAIPDQTFSSYVNTLDTILSLNPEHISAYGLIPEEGTPIYSIDRSRIPDEDTDRRMYRETGTRLQAHGYNRYEISNYAKENNICSHNMGYWTGKEYLGIGLGASSLINNTRFKETRDYGEFLSSGADCGYKDIDILSEKDRMEEFMFLGLRVISGINTACFEERFGVSYDSIYGNITSKFIMQKLLIKTGRNIRLTEKGIDVSNHVMSEFLL